MCFKLFKKKTIPEHKIVDEIDIIELSSLLFSEFGEDFSLFLSDPKFGLITKKNFEEFLNQDDTYKYKYVVTKYDCENYTWRLNGNLSIPGWAEVCKGIIWCSKPNHALNIFVDDKRRVYLVEPQKKCKIFIKPKDWKVRVIMI